MGKVYSYGTAEIDLVATDKVSVYSENSDTKIYQKTTYQSQPESWTLLTTVSAGVAYTSSAFSVPTTIRIEAGADGAAYGTGANATTVGDFKATRSTIADTGTVTVAEHQGLCLYQDASVASVTMTTATAANIAAALPNMQIGDAIPQYHASNHATNTSTIAGGTDVTLVGSGAVTSTGGQYLLIKTAAATFDLVRVG